LCGCGDSPEAQEARQQIGEAVERTGDYLAERGRSLRDQIATGLDGMDERLGQLDERAAAAGAEAKERWKQLSAEFSDEREVLDQKLEKWKAASGEAAAEAREEVEAAWQKVREKYRQMTDEVEEPAEERQP
jgi:ElaB/YqjD/DUF883 family membrane-anchored ribosome-binding protein